MASLRCSFMFIKEHNLIFYLLKEHDDVMKVLISLMFQKN